METMRDWDSVRAWRRQARQDLTRQRLALDARDRRAAGDAVRSALRPMLAARRGRAVALYWPVRGEIDVRPLAGGILRGGGTVALPVVVDRDGPLEFRRWTPDGPVEPGVWRIPVPTGPGAVEVAPDLVIVPLVGYDGERHRLGNGGGYYDRTLAAGAARGTPPYAIGVGFAFSRVPTIHPQPHDVRLDAIVTESEVL